MGPCVRGNRNELNIPPKNQVGPNRGSGNVVQHFPAGWLYGLIASKSWAHFLSLFGPFGPIGPFETYKIKYVTQYTAHSVTQYV